MGVWGWAVERGRGIERKEESESESVCPYRGGIR
jgi:hypothetical protein